MNLQVCIPYRKCPFRCPMCIATGRQKFDDLYSKNKDKYLKILKKEVVKYNDVILTGDTDPTLNREWLEDVISAIREVSPTKNIELQTRNYNLKSYNLDGLSTINYSITCLSDYLKAWNFRKINGINRLVILLTNDFQIFNTETFNPMGFEQITFKVLQYSADENVNQYIKTHKLENIDNIYRIMHKYNGTDISVRVDENCQDSENRYRIFRSDGKIYKGWDSVEPTEERL